MTQKPPRNFVVIVEAMIVAAPETEDRFRRALKRLVESAKYKAPEQMAGMWLLAGEVLYDFFGETPADGWQKAVVNIFTDVVEIPGARPTPLELVQEDHDDLSQLLEDPNSRPEDIRAAAVTLCVALHSYYETLKK